MADNCYSRRLIGVQVKKGVKFGEGDGTVPLLSLGAMCVRGWKDPKWNPAGIKVVTKGMSFCFFASASSDKRPSHRIQA